LKLQDAKKNFTGTEILSGSFGLEREGLRVTQDGHLAQTDHPEIFGSKIENPYITTDFSESQVEVVTPPYDSLTKTYGVLEGLCNIVNNEIGPDEFLWPGSMPCIAPEDDQIRIAVYGTGEKARSYEAYRKSLIQKYGGKKQLLTGIHFNFSLSDAFLEKLRKLEEPQTSFRDFKDKVYLKIARGYLKYRWLVIYLTGCSSARHISYDCSQNNGMTQSDDESYVSDLGPSFRNSACGYKNLVDLFPSYDSVRAYTDDVQSFVDAGLISEAKELYTQIRLKTRDKDRVLESLLEDGIEYLEIRTIDLNLFDKIGVALSDLRFIQLLLIWILFSDENNGENWQEEGLKNELDTASFGLKPDLMLLKDGKEIPFREYALSILDELAQADQLLGLASADILDEMRSRIEHPETTYAASLASLVKKDGYITEMMKFARAYKEDSQHFRYLFKGFENYELSTQILMKEAMTRGIKTEELDPQDNFILLTGKDGREQLVKQATKTQADNYASVLAMENKVVTKKILARNGIPVPDGAEFNSMDAARARLSLYAERPVVIKPKSTNYGTGIFMFEHGAPEEDLIAAAEGAFKYDDTILIEDYIPGREYRFLTIGGKTAAVMNRVAANVVGDGRSTIQELMEKKNEHPFRGNHYESPLENLRIDEQTILYLKGQDLTPESVPERGETVYLRGNSNVSTGGDSVDITDEMPDFFKRIAEKAADAIGAVFCGVDMIIEDYTNTQSTYGIIELNFNPATHMHAYPYKGKERRTGAYILSALGLIDEDFDTIDKK
jgi:glutamate--cysteine ligase